MSVTLMVMASTTMSAHKYASALRVAGETLPCPATADIAVEDSIQTKATAQPWKCILKCEAENTRLVIDLYEESVDVPGMDMFGPMNGYLGGNIYGVWSVTSFSIVDDKNVTLRLSNDLGSETQECKLSIEPDGTYRLQLKGTTVIKRVEKKKLVKVASTMVFVPSK